MFFCLQDLNTLPTHTDRIITACNFRTMRVYDPPAVPVRFSDKKLIAVHGSCHIVRVAWHR